MKTNLPHILIVDDDKRILELINDFLVKNNFTLVAALKFPFMLYEDRIYIQKE